MELQKPSVVSNGHGVVLVIGQIYIARDVITSTCVSKKSASNSTINIFNDFKMGKGVTF